MGEIFIMAIPREKDDYFSSISPSLHSCDVRMAAVDDREDQPEPVTLRITRRVNKTACSRLSAAASHFSMESQACVLVDSEIH